MNSESFDIVSPNYNNEILDIIDKAWKKSTATTKEQKDKNVFDIFHTFLACLNKALISSSSAELADIVLEKSVYMAETTGIFEWPPVETLKLSDLNRNSILLYNYLKFKFSNNKNAKDSAFKAFENLNKLVDCIIDTTYTHEMILNIFNDYFAFYTKAKETSTEENKTKCQEDIEAIIQMLLEETSKIFFNYLDISNLLRMKSIDSGSYKYFFIGCLSTILAYKFNKYEKTDTFDGIVATISDAFNHEEMLKKISPVLFYDAVFVRAYEHFITEEKVDDSTVEMLIKSYKELKTYIRFRKK
jgi:hypothetical protein